MPSRASFPVLRGWIAGPCPSSFKMVTETGANDLMRLAMIVSSPRPSRIKSAQCRRLLPSAQPRPDKKLRSKETSRCRRRTLR